MPEPEFFIIKLVGEREWFEDEVPIEYTIGRHSKILGLWKTDELKILLKPGSDSDLMTWDSEEDIRRVFKNWRQERKKWRGKRKTLLDQFEFTALTGVIRIQGVKLNKWEKLSF